MFTTTRHGRGAVTVTTALAAAALVAGLTGTTTFANTTGPGGDGPTTVAAATARGGTATAGPHWVTLITGDRVAVDARGRVVSVDPARGREKIPVRSSTENGRAFVVPADAEQLIARGTLDRRLFDVTGLSTPESRRAYRKGLKVIVTYEGGDGPAARRSARGDAEVRRTLPSLNADALTIPERDAGALWDSLTRSGAGGARSTRTVFGVAKVWLDAVRTTQLDRSVAQVGAPKVWQAGYDGRGVTVAVLDTGVDKSHADLKGQVVGERNFSDSPDARDRDGHGTHVASTVAGTGARSGGKHKGVAPGARILSAKVLDDESLGEDSGIIAGMDWAVAQGADVINMSLGGRDQPGIDPLEAHVNKLSKETDVLFAIAAGNHGPDAGSLGSPGTADAALTVGAVDDTGRMASFSSRGPRAGDGAVKPDVTAPGVAVTAASARGSATAVQEGERPAGYVGISGTSMATPHVAGAAALLKQRHPSWSGERIKAVLTASAKDGGHSLFAQGAGQIAVDRALEQTVVSDGTGLSFGFHSWPHTDDKPVTRRITYRNLGTQDITLDLAVKAVDPKGRPSPAGLFALGAGQVTVPAGGTATVPLTADTRIGGTNDGTHTATVVATGGGQTVRTTAAVEREVESYALTLKHIGRDGKPGKDFTSVAHQLAGLGGETVKVAERRASATLRLPKGDYALISERFSHVPGFDSLIQPRLALTKNTTVTIDARRAKPVSIKIPDPKARSTGGTMTYLIGKGDRTVAWRFPFDPSRDDFRTAQLGPAQPTGVTVKQTFHGQWERRATQYNAVVGGTVKRLATGVNKRFKAADFAKISVHMGAAAKGKSGSTTVVSGLDRISHRPWDSFALPGTRTHYVATDGKRSPWSVNAVQATAGDEGWNETEFSSPARQYAAGDSHRVIIGRAVHSPMMDSYAGVFRHEDRIHVDVPLFSDAGNNAGESLYASARTTLHKGAERIRESAEPLSGRNGLAVDPEDAEYTLATSVKRNASVSRVGTRVDASWTFRSARPAGDEETRTPLSAVRFGAPVAMDGTVPAGRTVTFPVTVQGPAAGRGLKSLAVSVSYDGGKSWKKPAVTQGRVTLKNPAKGKSLALRGEVTDKKGGKASITVFDAYFGR
ncbi:S8 family peptidase [Streptomyces yaizuensis]|uniref:S8 family serine peptidase n=1 Tax=Streptomyces yaizuensis TaxID=2989713 RepID=A0ABQ5NS91_9ACTN|nr:S8 family serine peptidase [Streptomyces sp. YSPA8]GLF93239.1 S8 family serine peptidase [Streptomyces sp. YSPA8]